MKRIDKLFLQFAAFYGQIWRSQLKEEGFISFMKNEWYDALFQFNNRVIELAVDTCRFSGALPPTLPQFVEICRGIKRRDAFIKPVPLATQTVTEVGRNHLLKIKKLLIK